MHDFIQFREPEKINGRLKFILLKSAAVKLYESNKDIESVFRNLSMQTSLLFTNSKQDGKYDLNTESGVFGCLFDQQSGAFKIITYHENRLINQNIALKYGITFKIPEGAAIFVVTLNEPLSIKKAFYKGKAIPPEYTANLNTSSNIKVIVQCLEERKALENYEEEAEVEVKEEYQPERKLARLLETAEQYAELANEIEMARVNETGSLIYYKIESVEYDRIDRVAYKFFFHSIVADKFKPGVQIQIDCNGKRITGEILPYNEQDLEEEQALVILFNEQVNIDELPASGTITLSYSSVIRDVQIEAIEKIRKGTAPAKYMDDVLGRKKPAGFQEKDLTLLKENLMKREYPPNDSQIKAIEKGICSKDVFLVMGPPGTGKTTVILEWVKYFVKQERKRVLVSSQNNKAVDNVLARIADEDGINIIRIGSEAKMQEEVIPFMFENKLKTLREEIEHKTSGNISDINDLISHWQGRCEEWENIVTNNAKLTKIDKVIEDKISSDLLPLYRELEKALDQHAEYCRKMEKLHAKIEEITEKKVKYENISNTFVKAFLFVPNIVRRIYINVLIKRFNGLILASESIEKFYNDNIKNYKDLYDEIYNTYVNEYFDQRDIRDRLLESTGTEDEGINAKWSLFRNIKVGYEDLCDNSKLLCHLADITEELKRARQTAEVINAWKEANNDSQNYALNEVLLESVDLVGATCIGINSQKRFANLKFDVTIIDEAGQIQIHNALVPMSVSNKLIMLGDHKQIPPSAQDLLRPCEENGFDTELLSKSLFEKMYEELPDSNKIMLDTQYRMPGEIADIISEWFYDGEYKSPPFKRNMEPYIKCLSEKPFLIIDTSKEKNRFETRIEGGGANNRLEAEIAADIVNLAAAEGIEVKDIGIISAYKAQVKLIRELLGNSFDKDTVREIVATLDSFQGQERNLIIYSFTKSSNRDAKSSRIGFLNELRRLNVAMSRCKKMLILIGDMDFLSSCEHMDADEDGNPVYEMSEKQFSDFIRKVLDDVNKGRGELIDVREAKHRIMMKQGVA